MRRSPSCLASCCRRPERKQINLMTIILLFIYHERPLKLLLAPLVLRKLSLLLGDGVDHQASLQTLLNVVEDDGLHLQAVKSKLFSS